MKRKSIKKMLSMLLVLAMVISGSSISAFAAEEKPEAIQKNENTITFSNLDALQANESIEIEVLDLNGETAVISVEAIEGKTRASVQGWKVRYTSGVINAHFYMTVSGNKVTSVYDDWILTIGGTYSDETLTKTSTYGKLSFKFESYLGIISSKCWLKGTVTGSDNDIDVSWQM